MTRTSRFLGVALILFAGVFMTGCASNHYTKSIAAFSNAAAPAIDNVDAAYVSVNDAHTLAEQAVLVQNFDKEFRPAPLQPFISPEELATRKKATSVLRQYAQLVGDLAIGKQPPPATSSFFSTTAKTATSAAPASTTKTAAGKMTSQQMDALLSGLDVVVKPYLNFKIRRQLPPLVRAADPLVQQVCTLLSADLVTLQVQTDLDYWTLLMEQDQFIEDNQTRMDAIQKRDQVIKLFQIEADSKKADDAIAATQDAVKKLAETHHRLATGGTK